jgi:hypothetical protein
MPRTRQIRPGFFKNAELCELQPLVRLLFAGLWTVADCAGRLVDRPKVLKGELLAYDQVNVDKALDELAGRGFIERYEVDGQRYIQVRNWSKHQHPHPREEASTIPSKAGLGPDSDNEVHTENPASGTISDAMTRAPVLVASSSFPSSSFNPSLREENPPTPLAKGGRVRRRRNGHDAAGGNDAAEPVCRCDELRADLAENRNSYPFCELHGDVRKVTVTP